MSEPAARTTLDIWERKTASLEPVLVRGGRADLLPALTTIRGLIIALSAAAEDGQSSMPLLARAISELKGCVMDPRRHCDPLLYDEIERATREARAREMSRAERASWADTLLSTFGNVDDTAFEKMLQSVTRLEAATPTATSRLRDELGTLREPLSDSKLQSASSNSARVLMKGELQPGLLADLIQLFSQNSETGRLVIEGSGALASIYFKNGKIVDAECGNETGEKAFFETMIIREGRFSYQRGVEGGETRIFRSAQHLIMETLRLIDESA
jgi:hypothetical protein